MTGTMKLAIAGVAGRMGRQLASAALEAGHTLTGASEAPGSDALGAPRQQEGAMFFGQQNDAQSYFKNVVEFNGDNMLQRDEKLKQEIQRKRKGVQVLQVK